MNRQIGGWTGSWMPTWIYEVFQIDKRKRRDIQAVYEQRHKKIAACGFALNEHRVDGM